MPVEQDYHRRTGIFPIMHVVVLRRDVYELDRWAARSLYRALVAARAEAWRGMDETAALRFMLPWLVADQHEPRSVRHRDALALNGCASHRGGVEKRVDEVVVQQIDLVDVEQPAMRRGEQAGLIVRHTFGQRAFQVERADHAVFGGADRQLDQPYRPPMSRRAVVRAVRASGVGRCRIAGKPAAVHDIDVRQQPGERAHHRRLRGSFLAAHQHTADGGRDRGEDQRQAQFRHPDDCGERVRLHSAPSTSSSLARPADHRTGKTSSSVV